MTWRSVAPCSAGLKVRAFYVKCDAETNPPEVRESGNIVTEIGLAAAPPTEFIVVRITHGPAGVRIQGPLPQEVASA